MTKIIARLVRHVFLNEENGVGYVKKRCGRYLKIREGSVFFPVLHVGRREVDAALIDLCGRVIFRIRESVQ